MKVTIYSHFEGKTWTGNVPNGSESHSKVNEQLFRLFNRVDSVDVARLEEWGYDLPSLSVGDRVEHHGLIWQVEPVGFELVSSSRLEELQVTYDRVRRHYGRVIRYYDECPDGDPRKAEALQQLDRLNARVREVEREQDEAVEWFSRHEEGEKVARLLDPLPAGTEFRLSSHSTVHSRWVPNAYGALYRKNEQGLWDQVKGTCPPPHVINMSPDHLGFVVGSAPIKAALKQDA